ncbi:MAG TPA: DUF2059 domain-containing protein, partial [Opitutaceae bacterium]|nr:DUF2059 domain-containing protein [Opitutaceae bacterium]
LVRLSVPDDMLEAAQKSVQDTEMKILDQALATYDLGKDDEAIKKKLKAQIGADVAAEFGKDYLREVYRNAFAKTYTQDEIDGILAFFDTPSGKAYQAKKGMLLTTINGEMSGRAVAFAAKMEQEIQQTMAQEMPPAAAPASAK